MFKFVFLWLLGIGFLADTVLIALKFFDVISWDWSLICLLPIAFAVLGTLVFAIIYLLIKIFVSIVLP